MTAIYRVFIFFLIIFVSDAAANAQVMNNSRWRAFNVSGGFDKYWNFNNDTVATSPDNISWTNVSVYSEAGNILTFHDLNSTNCNTADVGVYQFSLQLDTLRLADVHEPCTYRKNYMEDHYFVDFPIGINEQVFAKNVSVFPMPFSENLSIKSENESFDFVLLDISGRIISEKSFSGITTMNTEDLETGMYLYVLRQHRQIVKSGVAVKY